MRIIGKLIGVWSGIVITAQWKHLPLSGVEIVSSQNFSYSTINSFLFSFYLSNQLINKCIIKIQNLA